MKGYTPKPIRWLLSLVALIGLIGLIVPVHAQVPQEGFEETFDSADLEGWEHTPDIVISDGILRLYGGNFAFKMGAWGDQQTTINLRFLNQEGQFLVHLFATDQGSYNLVFTADEIRLEKSAGPGSVINFAETPNTIPAETWVELDIRVEAGEITITLDDEVILTGLDPDPIRMGTIGLVCEGSCLVEVESIRLDVLNGSAPPPIELGEDSISLEPTTVPLADRSASWFDTLQVLFEPQSSQVDMSVFIVNLLLSAVLSYILGRVYIYWGDSLSNRRKFAMNFMLITVTTTFIILVVRSSVALSLGLVGALSIVRFRTAVKEPEELAYLFFAIAIGIGLGDNQRVITILAFAVTIVIVGLLRLFKQTASDVNLHLTISSHNPEKLSLGQVTNGLKPHVAKMKLLRMDETPQSLELAFMVEFKHISDLEDAKTALQTLAPQASLTFLDNKGIW